MAECMWFQSIHLGDLNTTNDLGQKIYQLNGQLPGLSTDALKQTKTSQLLSADVRDCCWNILQQLQVQCKPAITIRFGILCCRNIKVPELDVSAF